MKHVDLSDEDFEYLRLMVRVKTNESSAYLDKLNDFVKGAHEHLPLLGDDVKIGDVLSLSAHALGLEIMCRIDEALEVAQDA